LLVHKGNGAWDLLDYLKQLGDPAIARQYAPLLSDTGDAGPNPFSRDYNKLVGMAMLSSIGDPR